MELRKISITPTLQVSVAAFNGIADDQCEAKKNGEKLSIAQIVVNLLNEHYEQRYKSTLCESVKDETENFEKANIEISEDKAIKNKADKAKKMNDIGYLTIEQASEYTGLNKQIIANARRNGELDSKKIGYRYFYKKDDLDVWFELYVEEKGDKTKKLYIETKKNKE